MTPSQYRKPNRRPISIETKIEIEDISSAPSAVESGDRIEVNGNLAFVLDGAGRLHFSREYDL